ncbi:MAG TPA: hypothetical protein VF292_13440 [Rhodanobacteraceae bacterium]
MNRLIAGAHGKRLSERDQHWMDEHVDGIPAEPPKTLEPVGRASDHNEHTYGVPVDAIDWDKQHADPGLDPLATALRDEREREADEAGLNDTGADAAEKADAAQRQADEALERAEAGALSEDLVDDFKRRHREANAAGQSEMLAVPDIGKTRAEHRADAQAKKAAKAYATAGRRGIKCNWWIHGCLMPLHAKPAPITVIDGLLLPSVTDDTPRRGGVLGLPPDRPPQATQVGHYCVTDPTGEPVPGGVRATWWSGSRVSSHYPRLVLSFNPCPATHANRKRAQAKTRAA